MVPNKIGDCIWDSKDAPLREEITDNVVAQEKETAMAANTVQ